MVTDSFVCTLAGWQSVKTHSRVGSMRERPGLVPIQGTVVLSLSKYTLTRTHAHTQTHKRRELSKESLFHADLLSLSNVWYAGIQALLNDLIFYGAAEAPACVHVCVQCLCLCVCVCEIICLQALPLDKTQDLPGQTDTD